jgi:hypothetical protein
MVRPWTLYRVSLGCPNVAALLVKLHTNITVKRRPVSNEVEHIHELHYYRVAGSAEYSKPHIFVHRMKRLVTKLSLLDWWLLQRNTHPSVRSQEHIKSVAVQYMP